MAVISISCELDLRNTIHVCAHLLDYYLLVCTNSNLVDKNASQKWRECDLEEGDYYKDGVGVEIGGKDKSESFAYFVARFFSKHLRWHKTFRGCVHHTGI